MDNILVLDPRMMDYTKTRDEAQRRKMELLERQQRIREDKRELSEEEEQIKRELIGLDQILEGLDLVSSDVPADVEPTGFTDSIRKILTKTSVPLVPTQIRDSLQARGFSGSSAKNLLINVHKVLDRIESELDRITTPDGKTAYRHKAARPLQSNHVPVVDLMAALKESLAEMDKNKKKTATETVEVHGIRRGRT
jgi:hypothetical protein